MLAVHRRPAALAVALAAAAAACAPERSSNHTTANAWEPPVTPVDCASGAGSIEGYFLAPNGYTAVVGATVTVSTVGGCTATTNYYGRFKFVGMPAGTVNVTATKGNFSVTGPGTVGGARVMLVIPADSVSLAYVPGSYDSIEDILTGLGFTPTAIAAANLPTTNLVPYDAVFLNCGLSEGPIAASTANLQAYVNGGGTLYASDWAGTYVSAIFPGYVNFVGKVGNSTTSPVTAQVLDADFVEALAKSTAAIQFELGAWLVIDTVTGGAATLLTGPATFGGATTTKPFAAQFSYGAGRVTYTSFHNESQATKDMQRLLESIIFAL